MRFSPALTSIPGLVAGLFTTPASAQDVTIERTIVARDVYLFRTSFDGYVRGNSIVIVNAQDVLVFDTNTRPSTARQIVREIRSLTDKPVRYVVNSHWHPDHWSGNEVYAEAFPGVQIIATEEAASYMRMIAPSWPITFQGTSRRVQAALDTARSTRRGSDGEPLTPEQLTAQETRTRLTVAMAAEMRNVRRTYPTLTYQDRLTLWSGDREFRLMSMTGDATGSTVLYLPGEEVLLMGDLLVHSTQWGSNGYALSPWLASLQELQRLDAKVVVPGHGPTFTDTRYLALVAELFETVIRQVRRALAQGLVTPEEVAAAMKLDDLRARFAAMNAAFSDDLITMAYREARDGMQSRR